VDFACEPRPADVAEARAELLLAEGDRRAAGKRECAEGAGPLLFERRARETLRRLGGAEMSAYERSERTAGDAAGVHPNPARGSSPYVHPATSPIWIWVVARMSPERLWGRVPVPTTRGVWQ
jgi:hypothetical protein